MEKKTSKHSSKIDVAVILIFFNRPKMLAETFAQVKKARPSKLFLAQDGPRANNEKDIEKIKLCREVVSDIDWNCEVFYNYSSENLGCGMRMYSAISWAFESVEKLIILEDDVIASSSFFLFASEMLERYANDERISRISGMNQLGTYTGPTSSYFFSKKGAVSGWATWKRVWTDVEYEIQFKSDQYILKLLQRSIYPKQQADFMIKKAVLVANKMLSGEKLSAWTYQFRMTEHLYSRLIIVPCNNLTSHIGVGEDSTHNKTPLSEILNQKNSVHLMPAQELDFPLIHPKYMVEDKYYFDLVEKKMTANPPMQYRIKRKFKSFFRK